MPIIEPAVFARLMKLPNAARVDLLECVAATRMAPRQVEALVDEQMRAVRDRHGLDILNEDGR